jgi:HAMP domain-containing protein
VRSFPGSTLRARLLLVVVLAIAPIFALVVAWLSGDLFIVRRTRALVDATRRLAAGDLSARTEVPYGRGEIG